VHQAADPQEVVETLLPVAHAARHARDIVTEACLRWDVAALLGPATLIITELVANVIDHAHTIMTVRVTLRGQGLHLAVHDGSSRPPVLRAPDSAERRGLGLQLVAATSADWGHTPDDDGGGKVVWATVSAQPAGA
jgi:two-component sensor histidine kinase